MTGDPYPEITTAPMPQSPLRRAEVRRQSERDALNEYKRMLNQLDRECQLSIQFYPRNKEED